MTIDQLNKLTDEEVRVRVARALGLNVVDVPFIPARVNQDSVFTKAAHEHMLKVYPMGRFARIPPYDSDLNAAFTLVEKLRGEGCGICIYTTSNGTWQMYVRRHGHDAEPIVEHPSLARAICLCFLAVTQREEG